MPRATSDSATRWQTDIAEYAVPHSRLRAVAGVLQRIGCKSVTDVGCATGALRSLLPGDVDYHGVDFVDGLQLDEPVAFTAVDLNGSELAPIDIDTEWIVCSGIVEYVRDVPRFLAWLRASTRRPDTRLILTYFNDAHLLRRWWHVRGRETAGHPDWVPLMSRRNLLNRLDAAGFVVEESFDHGRGFGSSLTAEQSRTQPPSVYRADWRSVLFAHQWIFVLAIGAEGSATGG
jgi:hypothetical protein